MAYISASDVKRIRDTLKKEMPEYKFSVRGHRGSSVDITFVKGPAFEGLNTDVSYYQINHHHTEKFYGEKNAKVFDKVKEIAYTAPEKEYYNNSDAMIDYFDVAYYVHINVGRFEKVYEAV